MRVGLGLSKTTGIPVDKLQEATVFQGYVAKKVILVGQLSDGYINVTPMCQAKGKRYHDWGQRGELVPWWLVPI